MGEGRSSTWHLAILSLRQGGLKDQTCLARELTELASSFLTDSCGSLVAALLVVSTTPLLRFSPQDQVFIIISDKSLNKKLFHMNYIIVPQSSGIWKPGPSLPIPVAFHCMVQYNSSHTFIAGGHNDDGSSQAAYFYYGGTFHPLARMLSPRSHHMCTSYQGLILVIGGWTPGHDYLDTTEIYSPDRDTWRTGEEEKESLLKMLLEKLFCCFSKFRIKCDQALKIFLAL